MLFYPLLILLLVSYVYGSQWMFQSEKKWDQEWSAGSWDYMEKVLIERSKNAIIGSVFIPMYASTNSSVLDIGCGEGAISDFVSDKQKSMYVGVDLSKEAIKIARTKRPHTTGVRFVHASVYDFMPRHHFDVIIFSDVLYYVDSEVILKKYAEYLNPNGIMIISIFSYSMDKLMYENIFNVARNMFQKLDELDLGGYTRKKADGNLEKTAFHLEIYRKK